MSRIGDAEGADDGAEEGVAVGAEDGAKDAIVGAGDGSAGISRLGKLKLGLVKPKLRLTELSA